MTKNEIDEFVAGTQMQMAGELPYEVMVIAPTKRFFELLDKMIKEMESKNDTQRKD